MTVWSDENEVDSAEPGENVKLKLKNVEEDVSLVSYLKICTQFVQGLGRLSWNECSRCSFVVETL